MDAASAVSDARGDVDDLVADRGGAGLAVVAGGQMPGGAGEVVRDAGAGQPGGVGREVAGGQVSQRAVDELGVDLFDDGVAAVLGLGLH